MKISSPGRSIASRTGISVCSAPICSEVLAPADAEKLADAFAALADPVRLRLLSLMSCIGPGNETCACDLVEPAGRSQPTVSHHLKVLTEAGLVKSEKRGRWVWYSVDRSKLRDLAAVLR